MIIVSITL